MFALTLSGGFVFVSLIGYWRGAEHITVVGAILAALSFLASLIVPGRLEPARRRWMKLGDVIGYVTTPLILAVVYYAVITPVAIARRAIVRRPRLEDTGWHRRQPLPPPERLERQF